MTDGRPAMKPLRTAAAVFAGLFSAAPAFAANGASFAIIGYSPDARYFAFEQYGYEDASGDAYWDVFVLDLQSRAMVGGAPFHAVLSGAKESVLLSTVRASAMKAAQPVLTGKHITEPAEILAANPATEVVADRRRITFDREYTAMGSSPGGNAEIRHELSLTAIPLPRPKACPADGAETVGFTLTLTDLKLGSSHAIHTDKSLDDTRGCPMGYDVTAVIAHAGFPDTDRLVAIIGLYDGGWEGADQRFMAVPFTLSD